MQNEPKNLRRKRPEESMNSEDRENIELIAIGFGVLAFVFTLPVIVYRFMDGLTLVPEIIIASTMFICSLLFGAVAYFTSEEDVDDS